MRLQGARAAAGDLALAVAWGLTAVVQLGSWLVQGPTSLLSERTDDLAELTSALLAAVLAGLAARSTCGRLRWAWTSIAGAAAMWGAGQALWLGLRLAGLDPFPSPADLGYLLYAPLMLLGIALVPAELARLRSRDVVDGVILTLAVACVVWGWVLLPIVAAGNRSMLALGLAVAYPLGDAVTLTVAGLGIARATAHRGTLTRLATSVTAMAVADSGFAYLQTTGTFTDAHPIGLAWTTSFCLLASAALHQRRAVAAGPRHVATTPDLQDRVFVLPYVALAVAGVFAVLQWATDRPAQPVAVLLFVVAAALTLVRQYATLRDNRRLVSQLAAGQAELHRQAYLDSLTGLANRSLFTLRVADALEQHRQAKRPLAVLLCDLNDFKGVNDGLGHGAGDQLLAEIAVRLRATLRAQDVLARIGGDEFAVLIESSPVRRRAPGVGAAGTAPDAEDPLGARAVAQRLHEALRAPFAIAGSQVSVGLSVGIACVTAGDVTPSTDILVSRADIAMYTAKRSQQRRPVVFREGLALPEATDWQLRPPLEQALRDGAVQPLYQPVVCLQSGALYGFEALARWRRGYDVVCPAVFLPVAARAGLLPTLTLHMLRTASAQLVEWSSRPGLGHLRVSVNVSPAQLVDPAFPTMVRTVLEEFDVPVGGLALEITEEVLVNDVDAAIAAASTLRRLGIVLCLDDFGAGYSSLVHLHRLPLDVLKLDRAFVTGLDTDPELRRILTHLLALGADLGLDVIAEGVEHESQAHALSELGCGFGQGFLYSGARDPLSLEPLLGRAAHAGAAVRVPTARSA